MKLRLEWKTARPAEPAVQEVSVPGRLAPPAGADAGSLSGELLPAPERGGILFRPGSISKEARWTRPLHEPQPLDPNRDRTLAVGDVLRAGDLGVRIGGFAHRPPVALPHDWRGHLPGHRKALTAAVSFEGDHVLQDLLRLERRVGAAGDARESLDILARGLLDAFRGATWTAILEFAPSAQGDRYLRLRLSLAEVPTSGDVHEFELNVPPLMEAVKAAESQFWTWESEPPFGPPGTMLVVAPTFRVEEGGRVGPEDVNGLALVVGDFLNLDYDARFLAFFRQRIGAILHAEAAEASRRWLTREVRTLTRVRDEALEQARHLGSQIAALREAAPGKLVPEVDAAARTASALAETLRTPGGDTLPAAEAASSFAPYDLSDLRRGVEVVCAARRDQTGPRDVELRFFRGPQGACWEVVCDREQVWIAVRNMVLNAFDHGFGPGPTGSTPRRLSFILHVGECVPGPVVLLPFACLAVANTGAPIPKEELERLACGGPDALFDRDVSLEGRKGLGLHQLLSIARAHRGYVHFGSSQESGTVFAVFLPAVKTEAERTQYPAPDLRATLWRPDRVAFFLREQLTPENVWT